MPLALRAMLMKTSKDFLLRYGIALASTGVASLLAFCLKPFLAQGIIILYIPAVMTSALYGGLGPGLFATALSVIITAFFFLDPTLSFVIHSADDIAELAVFSLVAFLISLLNTAQKKAQQALLDSRERIRLIVDVTQAANEAETIGHAFRFALRRICEDGHWVYAHVYFAAAGPMLPSAYFHPAAEDRYRALRDATLRRPLAKGEGLAGRAMESGRVEWADELRGDPAASAYEAFIQAGVRSAAAFPVRVGREIVGVFEYFSPERMEKSEALVDLMEVVGLELGRVVERQRLQEGYSEAVWEQQRVIAQELHDGLGQQLTGLGFISQTLSGKLTQPDEAKAAARLTDGLMKALDQIRGLAKGVFPVAPEGEGLMSALGQLAETTAAATGIACTFDCPRPVLIRNNQVALHLYRIAQEAVTNAAKHARPSTISILLDSGPDGLRLSVSDDGSGLAADGGASPGSGLRSMRYRAASIGGTLRIEGVPGKGSRVSCLVTDVESPIG